MDPEPLDATRLGTLYRSREASPVEALEGALERIEGRDGELGCFLHVDREGARAEARSSELRHRAGSPLGPLDGVPVALKDNLCVRGQPATAGSRILAGHRPLYDAHVVERLRAGGALIVGKTSMDEFGMGSSNEFSAFGPVRNPWDLTRVPGGSSGGSAAAVAAGLVPLALGSDTGGSVRQPAALCGVLGLRPTWGAVSRRGLIAFASSLDQVGPLARSVRDIALLLQAVAGHDPGDGTSDPAPRPDYAGRLEADPAGLRVGVPCEYLAQALDGEVKDAVARARRWLEAAGARTRDVSLPHAGIGIACYHLIADAEASSNLARYDGIRYGMRVEAEGLASRYMRTRGQGFGPEVKRRILLGTFALREGSREAHYGAAERARLSIRADFAGVFEEVDALLGPVSPRTAFPLGEGLQDPLAMYAMDTLTVPAALAGIPALSVPCGLSAEGLPLGVQLMGPWWGEPRLLQLASLIERSRGPVPRVAPVRRRGGGA